MLKKADMKAGVRILFNQNPMKACDKFNANWQFNNCIGHKNIPNDPPNPMIIVPFNTATVLDVPKKYSAYYKNDTSVMIHLDVDGLGDGYFYWNPVRYNAIII